ncbi:MAG: hypothetical protein JO010_01445 [Alphaproteobacteria bacterium]|nr:hypothetical protein [Alphaproteobacteria bacterium]
MQGWRRAASRLTPAALVALGALAGAAGAQERVGVDAGLHEGFARIVFTWPAKADFTAALDGAVLTIHFARPLAADLQAIAHRIDGYVESMAMSGDSDVVARLRRPLAWRGTAFDNKIAIDLLDKDAPGPQPVRNAAATPIDASPSSALKPGAIAVRQDEENGVRRLVFPWTRPTGYTVSVKDGEARLRFRKSAPLDIAQLTTDAPDLAPRAEQEGDDLTLTLRLPPHSHLHAARDGNQVVVTFGMSRAKSAAEKPAAPPAQAAAANPALAAVPPVLAPAPTTSAAPALSAPAREEPSDAASAQASPATPPVGDEPAPLAQASGAESDGATLRFAFQRPVSAAVFRQGEALWIVFGAAALEVDLAELRAQGQGVVRSIERLPSAEATILRLVTSGGFNPSIRRSETGWVVALSRQLLHPDAPIGVSLQPAAQPPRIMLGVREPGAAVSFRDPELGESFIVVPVNQAGEGIAREQKLVELTILPTAQGIALQRASDGIAVKPLDTGIEVTSAAGLLLSGDRDRSLRRGDTPQRLFNFPEWSGAGEVLARRRALEANIVAAAPASRSAARLDLARFYFARGLAAEAIGVIQAIERDEPDFAAAPRVRAVMGGALLLAQRPEEAERELRSNALDGGQEIELWRGSLAFAKHDLPEAASAFAKGAALLGTYPLPLRHRFALEAAEAALSIGQQDEAQDYLALLKDATSPSDAAAARYLTALALRRGGEDDSAHAILDKLAKGEDREARARALLTQTLDDLDAGKLARGDAIAKLDALRFAWRGDAFELTLLHRLGALKIKDGDYRGGFSALRQALDNFPDHPEHRAIEQELAQGFADIFLGPDAQNIPPLKALALYDEFKDLTPAGAKGDEIIRRLADRLVAIDLLGRAADLLERQVHDRLTGRDKARVAARLAVVRLLDRKPGEALGALDIDAGTDIDPDLQRQRQQLRARALSDLGRSEEALQVIESDRSRDADRLRADIAWRTRNWAEAAKIFERLAVAPEGKLGKEDARIILDWATALTLSGNQAALAQVTRAYGAAMDESPFRDAFRVVAGDTAAAKGDIRQLAAKVAQIGELQSFMADYRRKLTDKSLSAIN